MYCVNSEKQIIILFIDDRFLVWNIFTILDWPDMVFATFNTVVDGECWQV